MNAIDRVFLQSPSKFIFKLDLFLPNTLHGPFSRWICEINATDLGNVPCCTPVSCHPPPFCSALDHCVVSRFPLTRHIKPTPSVAPINSLTVGKFWPVLGPAQQIPACDRGRQIPYVSDDSGAHVRFLPSLTHTQKTHTHAPSCSVYR